jgi:hypothetical protein
MNNLFFLFILLVCSCSQSKYMTFESYHDIAIGQNISDVQVQMGRPYEVKEISDHKQEYIYIERLPFGDNREFFRKYILIVEHGKVIDKRLKEESPPPVQFIG